MENKKEPTTNVIDSVIACLNFTHKPATNQAKKPVQLLLFNSATLLLPTSRGDKNVA